MSGNKGHVTYQNGKPLAGLCHCVIGEAHSAELYEPVTSAETYGPSENRMACACTGGGCIGCEAIACPENADREDGLCPACRDHKELRAAKGMTNLYARYMHCHQARKNEMQSRGDSPWI